MSLYLGCGYTFASHYIIYDFCAVGKQMPPRPVSGRSVVLKTTAYNIAHSGHLHVRDKRILGNDRKNVNSGASTNVGIFEKSPQCDKGAYRG